MIPRLIHQIWLGESGGAVPPERFERTARTWREMNPSWEYRLWSGADVDALFARVRPDLLELYRTYPYWVERADAARYLILWALGGVYADHDIACVRSLDPLVDAEVVLAPTEPVGLSNDLMAAAPGHPLFASLLDALPAQRKRWHRAWVPRHFRIMCGTGSLFLTRGVRHAGGGPGFRLLARAEYGHGEPEAAFVRHEEGNTWASWDTRLLIFVSEHWRVVAFVMLAAASLLLWSMRP